MSENSYELPEGWAWTTLVDSCCCVPTGIERFAGTVEYYSTGSIKTFSCTPEGTYTFSKRPSRANRLAKKRDVFQARMAGTNKALLIGNALEGKLFSTGFIQLREYSCSHGMHSYIYYYVESPYFLKQRDTYATGSTQVALTDAGLRKIAFPLAPLNEQKRIVIKIESLLDRLNKSKQELAKIPPLIKKFRQSVLARAFSGELTKEWRGQQKDLEPASLLLERIRTERKKQLVKKHKGLIAIDTSSLPDFPERWEWTSFESIADIIMGQSPPSSSYNLQRKGLPFFQGKAEFGEFYPVPVKWCNSPKRIAESGDILISVRAPVGPTNLADQKCCIGRGLAAVRPLQGIPSRFVLYYLRSIEEKLSKQGQGSTFTAIGKDDLKIIPFPVPPLEEQDIITNKIEEFFAQADTIEKSVKIAQSNCKKLTQSILAKAFRGELVEQDQNDEPAEELLNKIEKKKI